MGFLDLAVSALDEIIVDRNDGVISAPADDSGMLIPGMDPHDPDVFAEEPVPLDVFIRDRKFMRGPQLSDEQFKLLALAETIYFPQTYELLDWPYMKESWWRLGVTELVAEWGKGSGKDMVARYAVARACYLVLCLKDPKRYYNMDPDSTIDCLNIARSSLQANRVFFKPLRRTIERSPWFHAHGIDPKDGVIEFAGDVAAHSGHANSDSLEGLNLIISVADEIAAFKTPQELTTRLTPRASQLDADAAVDMMRSSGQSRFPKMAKLIGLSYPRFRNDYIQQWRKRMENDPSGYGTKRKTWEVNPTKSKAMYADEYRKDPDKARAKYECDPPFAENPFFRNVAIIDEALKDTSRDPVQDTGHLLPDTEFRHRKPIAVHLDLALTKDRCAISLCHVMDWIVIQTSDGHPLYKPIVFMDLVTSFSASELGLAEIDLPDVEFFLIECMHRGAQIRKITADQFQSKMMLQSLKNRGIPTDHRSVDRDTSAYDMLKYTMRDGRFVGYHRARLNDELKSLQLINGIKVDHPEGGSKDEADAVAGATMGAIELGQDLRDNVVETEQRDWSNVQTDFHPVPGSRGPVPSRYRNFR